MSVDIKILEEEEIQIDKLSGKYITIDNELVSFKKKMFYATKLERERISMIEEK